MEATKERCVLALGYNGWGKGKTKREALKQWRKNAVLPRWQQVGKQIRVCIIDAPADCEIDQITGEVLRHQDSPPSKLIEHHTIKL